MISNAIMSVSIAQSPPRLENNEEQKQVDPLCEPRVFPLKVPIRVLPDKASAGDSISIPEVAEHIRKTWFEGVLSAETLQVSMPVAELRELVYFGAVELIKERKQLEDPRTFRVCLRWIVLYQRAWSANQNDEDLQILGPCWNELLQYGVKTGKQRHTLLDFATTAYQEFYERIRSTRNFDNAGNLGRIMLREASTPRQMVNAHKRIGRLWGSHMNRFPDKHDNWLSAVNTCVSHLMQAIEKLESSVDIEPDPSDKELYQFCGWALDKRFHAYEKQTDLLKAIDYLKVWFSQETIGTSSWSVAGDTLARAYWTKFIFNRNINDGKAGMEVFEKMLECETDNPTTLSGYAELLKQVTNAQVLPNSTRREIATRCIGLLEQCIASTPDDHPMLPSRLGKLSDSLLERYTFDGDVEDIEMAIAVQLSALELSKPKTVNYWIHIRQIADKYVKKYKNTNDMADIEAALQYIQQSIKLTDDKDIERKPWERAEAKAILARCYEASYLSRRGLPDLNKAIDSGDEALKLFQESDWPTQSILEDLGRYHLWRFEHLQRYNDAAKAIRLVRESIDQLRKVSGKGTVQREIDCLVILARIMRVRARIFRGEEDLHEAIRAGREALKLTDLEHSQYVSRAAELVWDLTARYKSLSSLADIKEAETIIDVASNSLQGRKIPATAKEKAFLQYQYGNICHCNWTAKSDINFGYKAVSHYNAAIQGDQSNIIYLQDYAALLIMIAGSTQADKDLMIAFQVTAGLLKTAQASGFQFDILGSEVLANLARLLFAKSNAQKAYMPFTIQLFQILSSMPNLQLSTRSWASERRAILAALHEKDFETASKYISAAVADLPRVLNPALSRQDQLRLVQAYWTLPSNALAYHLAANHSVTYALQLHEQARGALWNRLLQENDELSALDQVDQNLATSFRDLHTRLANPRKPLASFESETSMKYDMQDTYQDSQEYDRLLKQIRSQKGMEDFLLLPSQPEEVSLYAADGAIVVVNCAMDLSHAVIIVKDRVVALSLPDYSNSMGQNLYKKMKDALRLLADKDEAEATKLFHQVCLELWTAVAKPVIDKLDELLLENALEQWTSRPVHRIWWVTNQWMNVLPIHSAGDYAAKKGVEDSSTVLDRSISSYIPSLGALKFARKNNAARKASRLAVDARTSALLVAMTNTQGHPSLPHAQDEAAVVATDLMHRSISTEILSDHYANKKAVLESLQKASMAHFVCHGQVNIDDPLKSQLLLTNWQRLPLDVRTLIRAKASSCSMVYLSVCNAATSEVLPLVDEGLHIAGAFLMAGVPHVVATRWELLDELAITVAKRFYTKILGEDQGASAAEPFNGSSCAETLREVLLSIRKEGIPALLYNAYVHYGV